MTKTPCRATIANMKQKATQQVKGKPKINAAGQDVPMPTRGRMPQKASAAAPFIVGWPKASRQTDRQTDRV
ncbi:MAG: hypothetical protein FWG13_06845 [Leptospirales bacterium]|nr:hypothetical protein [Leptospirales bacterium]